MLDADTRANAELGTVAYKPDDLVGGMAGIDCDVANSRGGGQLELVLKDRLASNRHQRLRHVADERR